MEDNINTKGVSQTLQNEFEEYIQKDLQDCVREMRAQKWQLFLDEKIKTWTTQVMNLKISLPNAKNKQPYHQLVPLDVDGIFIKNASILNDSGLEITIADDKKSVAIDGIPQAEDPSGTFVVPVAIDYCHEDFPDLQLPTLRLKITVNPDPKDLWRNIPVPENIEYPKKDAEYEWINASHNGGKTVIAASKRGRSHAHEGKPRDDHFSINLTEEDWYVLVVADGAGSAPFSREGSRIACETTNRICVNQLDKNGKKLENFILSYVAEEDAKTKDDLRKKIGDVLYGCLAAASYLVKREITEVAKAKERQSKEYATTLLMAVAKKFQDFWFVGSFWIGDGAIGLYNDMDGSVKLMCEPDEGEYSGQTRFVTMDDLFNSVNKIYKRLRFFITKDFSSLMLMTDGVSDAFFETDKNLKDSLYWELLETNILHAINPDNQTEVSPETQAKRLLEWLDFWSPGNHDDRTIVIVH